MTAEEKKQQKAKQLRYKKPIAANMNLAYIQEQIWNMGELIQDVQWFCEDEDIDRRMWRNDLIGFAFIVEEQLITLNWPEPHEAWGVLHWYINTFDSKPFADYQASKTQVMEKLKEWDAG